MKIFKQLKKCELFQDFTDSELNKIFDTVEARIVKYSRGQLVAKENTEISELCILLDGNLVEYINKSNGEREVLRSIIDGEIYGLAQGFYKPNLLGYCVVSALDCTILYISIDSILKQSDCPFRHKLVINLLYALSNKIMELECNNSYITIKGMRLKIAKFIYDKYLENNNIELSLGMNRNEMAKYLNVSRPSMSREMARMQEIGLFDFWKDKITIKNIEGLREIVEKGE